jgi:hypothetical protein
MRGLFVISSTVAIVIVILGWQRLWFKKDYMPNDVSPRPITGVEDGFTTANLIATKWNSKVHVGQVNSVYRIVSGNPELVHIHYTFLAEDNMTYLGVTLKSSGVTITHAPTSIERSWVSTDTFVLEENDIKEAEAIDIAWERLGAKLDAACGPVEKITVEGSSFGSQMWSITYWGRNALLGYIAISAESGETIGDTPQVNHYFCENG